MDAPSDLKKGASVLCYVCRLRFPTYPPHYFPLYMLFRYNCIRRRRKAFELVALPYEAIERLIIRDGATFNDDINNTLVLSKTYLQSLAIGEDVVVINTKPAHLVGASGIPEDRAYISDTLHHNRRVNSTTLAYTTLSRLPKADEVDLSAISTCHDLGSALVDSLVTNYFRSLKIACVGDVISVELERYAPEFRYTNGKLHGLRFVHFRCNRLLVGEVGREFGVVVLGETSIKQSANVQSFLPAVISRTVTFDPADCERWSIDCCPYGLRVYSDRVVKAVRPFLKSNAIKLRPAFLVLGAKGSGKSTITSAVASSLGLHLFATTSGEINAAVYAQTESKLRHLFFKAKLCSPCLVHIKNFENFGKNNEGLYDDRILSFFAAQLEELFIHNNFPVILVCTSDSKEIPATLTRHFLEIFEIATPNTAQRAEILRWIVDARSIENNASLDEVAEKTHGFVLGDLRALVFYAKTRSVSKLEQGDFDSALDRMQAMYSQSLGAPKIPKVQWSDVGGLGDVKHEIIRTVNLPLQHPELLRATGLRRSGILLYGPPGTGKTLIAKAVATECNLCFLSVKGPELLNMYVGQSEQNVRQVFERARDAAPCIIFFDELDSLAPNRGISGDSGGVMDRVVSQLLAEMDGLNQSATVFIIGATNRPDLIDPALLRPGRFDKLLYVGPCTDPVSKIGVLKALTRKFKLAEDVDLEKIVRMCPANVTGADFYGLCSLAWSSCVRRLIETNTEDALLGLSSDDVMVELSDFQAALVGLQPSIKNEDLVYFERLRKEYTGEI
ncbi:peroxisome assembly factor 2 [Photinus pyralis]|nr:peroxisome assembly factor 2 [Photinus pyralis]